MNVPFAKCSFREMNVPFAKGSSFRYIAIPLNDLVDDVTKVCKDHPAEKIPYSSINYTELKNDDHRFIFRI